MDFEKWAELVDQAFIDITGLDRDSWPDQCYYDWWEDGVEPTEAVAMAIENEYGTEGLEAFDLEAAY